MDISRRKALEKKETEENAEVRTVEYGTSIPPHTMNHHPWLEREYQQPVAVKSSNTMFAIIALIAFLISGTLSSAYSCSTASQQSGAIMQNWHTFRTAYRFRCYR